MGLAHGSGDFLVVVHQLAQHLPRRDIALVVVFEGLQLGDLTDRAQRGAADLANPLGDLVGRAEYLLRLLIEQQMVVAEMPAADMPMKVLGLEIERKGIGIVFMATEILLTPSCERSVGVSSTGFTFRKAELLAWVTMHPLL